MQQNPYRRYEDCLKAIKSAQDIYQDKNEPLTLWEKIFGRSKKKQLKQQVEMLKIENRFLNEDFIKIETEMLGKLSKGVNVAISELKMKFSEYEPTIERTIVHNYGDELDYEHVIIKESEFKIPLPSVVFVSKLNKEKK